MSKFTEVWKSVAQKHLLGENEAAKIVQEMKRRGKSESEVIRRLIDGGFRNTDAVTFMENVGFYK